MKPSDSDLKNNMPKNVQIKKTDHNEIIENVDKLTIKKDISDFKKGKNINWRSEILTIIEKINKTEFTLEDVYAYEEDLSLKFPENHFVKEKIRQQLRIIREKGLIEFLGDGKYRKISKEQKIERPADKEKKAEKSIVEKNENNKPDIENSCWDCKNVIDLKGQSHCIIDNHIIYSLNKESCKNFITEKIDYIKKIDNVTIKDEISKVNSEETKKIRKIQTFSLALKDNIKDYDGPLADVIKYVPDFYELFESLLKEEKFDTHVRSIINAVVAYFVNPNDIISEEEFGPFGYIDDLYLCLYVLDKLYPEKDTVEKHWKRDEDVFELATYLKNQIEKVPEDTLEKEKLNAIIDYIAPFTKAILLSKFDGESTEKIVKKVDTNENNIIEYDSDRYFVRETDSCLELIDRETGFPSLTINKSTHAFKPKCTNKSVKKEVIEYDSAKYILRKNGQYLELISKDLNEGVKTFHKDRYIIIPKLYS